MSKMNRRNFMGAAGAGLMATVALPGAALALTTGEAQALITRVVGDIQNVINSGASESRMLSQFEGIFERYGNTQVIALRVLGSDARSASQAQLRNYVAAFEGYIARKYGRRFREFIGGQIAVINARPVKSWFEVQATVTLRGQAPFRVDFLVKEAGGRNLFFDLSIEGVSLTRVEREEVGAMLDRRGGNLDQLIADLRRAG